MRVVATLACALLAIAAQARAAVATRFLEQPTVRGTSVVFIHERELWAAPVRGGLAQRITSDGWPKEAPRISPDGNLVAFTERRAQNADVYTVPITGGAERRLTFHPSVDLVQGWTSDSAGILFTSPRYSRFGEPELFTLSISGDDLRRVPIGEAHDVAPAPDGRTVAYSPTQNEQAGTWSGYRGGEAPVLHLTSLTDYRDVVVPHTDAGDSNPVWLGKRLYFLSERTGISAIHSYDPERGVVGAAAITAPAGIDHMAGDGNLLVYESAGYLYRYDVSTGSTQRIDVRVPEPVGKGSALEDVSGQIESIALAPDGRTLAIEARGDIFIKREGARAVDVTHSSASAERSPVWSPDGSKIAYVSDEGGEEAIFLQSPGAGAKARSLGSERSGRPFDLSWSPDGHAIAYVARDLSIRIIDVKSAQHHRIASHLLIGSAPQWSHDGRGIYYLEQLPSGYGQARYADIASGTAVPLTEPSGHVRDFAVAADGSRLYVLASVEAGPVVSEYDVSSLLFGQSTEGTIYSVDLRGLASGSWPDRTLPSRTDAVRGSSGRYGFSVWDQPPFGHSLLVRSGSLFAVRRSGDAPTFAASGALSSEAGSQPDWSMVVFGDQAAGDARLETLAAGGQGPPLGDILRSGSLQPSAAPGADILLVDGKPFVLTLGSGASASLRPLELGPLYAEIDPAAERRQMLRDYWRAVRDYLWKDDAPARWNAVLHSYEPWLEDVRSPDDFQQVLRHLAAEASSSHLFIDPPAPEEEGRPDGLLGADLLARDGRVYFGAVLRGSSWDAVKAPLAHTSVEEGDQLISVGGVAVHGTEDAFRLLAGRAGVETGLGYRSSASSVPVSAVVVPVASERLLRWRQSVDATEAYVGIRSSNRIGYIHQPDTTELGLSEFIRGFYAQAGREALIIDERFSGGGADSDYQLDVLGRTPFVTYRIRDLETISGPRSMIDGPKVMLVNAQSISGSDVYPYHFKARGLGRVIGTRTWGGANGNFRQSIDPKTIPHRLVDGTEFIIPDLETLDPEGGHPIIENRGFVPDETVEISPADAAAGRDPQLDRAIDELMTAIGPPRPAPAAKD